MSTSEFDELLRQKMDEGDFDFAPATWTQMAQDLDNSAQQTAPAKRPRYWLTLVGTIAGAAAVWASAAFFMHTPDSNVVQPGVAVITPVHKTANAPSTIAATTNAPVTIPDNTTTSAPVLAANTKHVPAALTTGRPTKMSASAVVTYNNIPAADTPANEVAINNPAPADPLKATSKPVHVISPETNWATQDFKEAHDQPKASLGIAGGLNYGSANAGYTVGVNARRSLGGKFYLEGDLAIVNNATQNANTLSTTEYKQISTDISNTGTGTTPPINGVSAVKNAASKQSLNNVYYLQIAPSVGYRVFKKCSLSAGADLQRMLQHGSNETALSLSDNEIKLIPETDIGLTGKVEYGITSKLMAGVSYREGLNAMLDSKYMNRRYMQLQVKFLIFNK